MTTSRYFICIFFLVIPLMLTAQESTISPYSYFGIGDILDGQTSRTSGMASTAISLSGGTFLNTSNPASLTALDTCTFIFDITGSGKFSTFRSGTAKQTSSGANFSRITAGLHLMPRWSAGFSVLPYSTVSYKVMDENYIEGTGLTTPTVYEGTGGMTRLSFLNSYRLTEKFSLGADLMLLFGSIDRTVSQSGVTISNSSSGTSYSFVAGLQYRERLSENLHFAAGLTYGHSSELNLDNNRQVQDGAGTIVLADAITSSSIELPYSLGTGVSLTGRRFLAAADYRYQKWSQPGSRIGGFSFTDTHKLSCGMAFVPSRIASGSYLDIIEYQAGFSVSNSYLVLNNINPVNMEVTAGAVLPFRSGARINLGLAWGKNGTKQEGLIREDFVRFTLGLSMIERMFLKRMYD
jgi:hypothetical protein